MIAQIQSDTAKQGVEVVLINVFPQFSLEYWEEYWRSVGGGNAIFAEDFQHQAVSAFNVRTAGTKIILNRRGEIVYRSAGSITYEAFRAEIDKLL